MLKYSDSSTTCTEATLFNENEVNTIATDDLAPCIARASAAMIYRQVSNIRRTFVGN